MLWLVNQGKTCKWQQVQTWKRQSCFRREFFLHLSSCFFVCASFSLPCRVRTWRRVTTRPEWILIPRKRRRCKRKRQIKFMSSKEIRSTASASWRKCQDGGRRGNSANETTGCRQWWGPTVERLKNNMAASVSTISVEMIEIDIDALLQSYCPHHNSSNRLSAALW